MHVSDAKLELFQATSVCQQCTIDVKSMINVAS